MLEIRTFPLGNMDNNTYAILNSRTREAALIDPSFGSEYILRNLEQENYHLKAIWLTHAHFDHIIGVQEMAQYDDHLQIGLHFADLGLYQTGGGAGLINISLDNLPAPTIALDDNKILGLGGRRIRVIHTPGHSPGHVIFYIAALKTALVGDLIFYHTIGRTDLEGGDPRALFISLRDKLLTLPPETRLLPGHGQETTIAEERANNPYLTNMK